MRRLLLTLAIMLALPAVASGRVVSMRNPTAVRLPVFVNPDGTPARGPWLRWTAEADTPVPAVTITIEPAGYCPAGISGCTRGPQPDAPAGAPGIAATYQLYADSRATFYYELGHVEDWVALTDPDRAYLARSWQSSADWWDNSTATAAGLSQGVAVETGLEGVFPYAYELCAEGVPTIEQTFAPAIPGTMPTVHTGRFNTCRWLRSLGQLRS